MAMDQARKELKRQEDKQFPVFDDIPKELYEIRKSDEKVQGSQRQRLYSIFQQSATR